MKEHVTSDRRGEQRHYFRSGHRIAWRMSLPGMRRRKAWLNDMSRQGISLLIELHRAPHAGDVISVFFEGAGRDAQYEVLRRHELDDQLAVIAGRRVVTRN